MMTSLPIVNAETAKFECTFGRGCEGVCCQEGKPPLTDLDLANIEAAFPKIKSQMRDAARKKVDKIGYLSNWRKAGMPTLRVADGWCVFFNQGCLFHKLGMEEGDSFKYKPFYCAIFPLEQTEKGDWYIRQRGLEKEKWDVFCLNPKNSPKLAVESMKDEIACVEKYEQHLAEEEAKKKKKKKK